MTQTRIAEIIPIMRKIRETLDMPPPEGSWWGNLTKLDRRYLLAEVREHAAMAQLEWQDIPTSCRGRIRAAADAIRERLSDKRAGLAV